MTKHAVDEIIVVFGLGLAHAIERGEMYGRPFVRFQDHGPTGNLGMWEWTENTRALDAAEALVALQREHREAAARGVGCDSQGCWCAPYLSQSKPSDKVAT